MADINSLISQRDSLVTRFLDECKVVLTMLETKKGQFKTAYIDAVKDKKDQIKADRDAHKGRMIDANLRAMIARYEHDPDVKKMIDEIGKIDQQVVADLNALTKETGKEVALIHDIIVKLNKEITNIHTAQDLVTGARSDVKKITNLQWENIYSEITTTINTTKAIEEEEAALKQVIDEVRHMEALVKAYEIKVFQLHEELDKRIRADEAKFDTETKRALNDFVDHKAATYGTNKISWGPTTYDHIKAELERISQETGLPASPNVDAFIKNYVEAVRHKDIDHAHRPPGTYP